MQRHKLLKSLSKRSEISSFIAMDILAAANTIEARGGDIIHMEVGQPSTPAPKAAIDAAKRALQDEKLGYTEALGIPELRQRISQYYKDIYDVEVIPDRIVATTGSSAGFILAFLSLFDEGDTLALPSPGYPSYRHILKSLGIKTFLIETTEKTRWMPEAADIKRAVQSANIKGLLLASPANPTGTMLKGNSLEKLVGECRAENIWFISDEIYHGLTYSEPAKTALQFSDDAIVLNSFSKYFSMTGWRIGWMVVPEALVRTIERLEQNLFISPPTLSQHAAIAAMGAIEELEAYKSVYNDNRDLLLEELPKAGLDHFSPADGAFYLYADVQNFTDNSVEFAKEMLARTGVAATPGVDFDTLRGKHYLRFSYAGKTEKMAEAAKRLRHWLAK